MSDTLVKMPSLTLPQPAAVTRVPLAGSSRARAMGCTFSAEEHINFGIVRIGYEVVHPSTVQLEGLGQDGEGNVVVQVGRAPGLVDLEVPAGDDLLGGLRRGLVVGSGGDLDKAGSVEAVGGSEDDGVGDDGAAAEVEPVDAQGNDEGVLVLGLGLNAANDAGDGLAGGGLAGVQQVGVQDNPVLENVRASLEKIRSSRLSAVEGV